MDSLANEADRRKRMRTEDVNGQDHASSSPPSHAFGADPRAGPQPKRVACTNCRQSKLRCDSPKNPCTRCARLGLTCNTDTGYKRISKKSKIDELEEHVQQLRAVIDQNAATSSSGSPPVYNVSDASSRAPVPLVQPQYGSNSPVRPVINIQPAPLESRFIVPPPVSTSAMTYDKSGEPRLSRPLASKVRALESIAIERDRIDILFLIYFQNFHQYFPLLDPKRSPDDYYERSPLLFWTIIVIAARRFAADPALLGQIAVPTKELAWKRISDPPLCLADVQALLLLCMWPANTMRMWTDASMTFCNIAISAALHMGLHRPHYAKDFAKQPNLNMSEAEITERMNTWCACNIVSQFLTSSYGYPPVGSHFDWTIERACDPGNPYNIPDTMRFTLITQRFCNRVMKVMSGNLSDPRGMPSENEQFLLLDILEHDLDALISQWGKPLSPIQLMYHHVVRLYLHVFYWLGNDPPLSSASPNTTTGASTNTTSTSTTITTNNNDSNNTTPTTITTTNIQPSSSTGLLKSFATATSLLNHFSTTDSTSNLTAYAPTFLLLTTISASHLVSKILNSNLAPYVDVPSGEKSVETGLSLLRGFSVSENDLPQRAFNLLSDHWAHRNDDPAERERPPALTTKSRLGASMCYDCLFKWRHRSLSRGWMNTPQGVLRPTQSTDPNNPSTAVTTAGTVHANGLPIPSTTTTNPSTMVNGTATSIAYLMPPNTTTTTTTDPSNSNGNNNNNNANFLPLNWDDPFDDLNWNWDFDIPAISAIPVQVVGGMGMGGGVVGGQ